VTEEAILAAARHLAAFCPGDDRAVETVDLCLAGLRRSQWPDVAWRFSRLTADGCPVEFGFSDREEAFRATFEIAGPERPEGTRIDAAADLLRELDLAPAPDVLMRGWRAMQAAGALRWGCWLGLRWTETGVHAKLYVEAPREWRVPAPPPLSGARVRMLGYDFTRGTCETYVTLDGATEARLVAVLRELENETRRRLLDTLASIVGLPLQTALRWVGVGASVAQPSEPLRLALFIRARAVCGGAAAIRPRFSHRAGYRSLLGGRPENKLPDHGILTLIPHANGEVELRAGVSAAALAP
jgi:hypothetical protein